MKASAIILAFHTHKHSAAHIHYTRGPRIYSLLMFLCHFDELLSIERNGHNVDMRQPRESGGGVEAISAAAKPP